MSARRRNDQDIARKQQRGQNARVKTQPCAPPEWAGAKPGQHPALPAKPPRRGPPEAA